MVRDLTMEMTMTRKEQSGKVEKPRKQEGNLGQKEAQQERRSEAELAHMGESSKSDESDQKK